MRNQLYVPWNPIAGSTISAKSKLNGNRLDDRSEIDQQEAKGLHRSPSTRNRRQTID